MSAISNESETFNTYYQFVNRMNSISSYQVINIQYEDIQENDFPIEIRNVSIREKVNLFVEYENFDEVYMLKVFLLNILYTYIDWN